MSISGLHGRAYFDPSSLSEGDAFATCDRCGMVYTQKDLAWQYDWRGNSLMNLRILVCKQTCYDEPFEFNRPIILPPDPIPVLDARPGFYASQEGPPPNPAFLQQFIDEINGFPIVPTVNTLPDNVYLTEDSSGTYVAEDGTTYYVGE